VNEDESGSLIALKAENARLQSVVAELRAAASSQLRRLSLQYTTPRKSTAVSGSLRDGLQPLGALFEEDSKKEEESKGLVVYQEMAVGAMAADVETLKLITAQALEREKVQPKTVVLSL
jgi:hypothetical protein